VIWAKNIYTKTPKPSAQSWRSGGLILFRDDNEAAWPPWLLTAMAVDRNGC
jgi:hypothetical protein